MQERSAKGRAEPRAAHRHVDLQIVVREVSRKRLGSVSEASRKRLGKVDLQLVVVVVLPRWRGVAAAVALAAELLRRYIVAPIRLTNATLHRIAPENRRSYHGFLKRCRFRARSRLLAVMSSECMARTADSTTAVPTEDTSRRNARSHAPNRREHHSQPKS